MNNRRKKSGLKRWLKSYLWILLIPLICCCLFFIFNYADSWNDIKKTNKLIKDFIVDDMDAVFGNITESAYHLSQETDILKLSEMSTPLNSDDRYVLAGLAKKDYVNLAGNSIISEYLIYSPQSSVGIMNNSYTDFEGTYTFFGNTYGYSRDEWKKILETKQSNLFITAKDKESMAYVSTIAARGGVLLNLLFELDFNNINEVLSSVDIIENSGFAILDKDGESILFTNTDDINFGSIHDKIYGTNDYIEISVDGESFMVSKINSQYLGISYISLIRYDEYWAKSFRMLTLFFVLFLLSAAMGVLLAYCFAVKKERVYGSLISFIRENNMLAGNAKDEEKMIKTAVNNIIIEYKNMQREIISNKEMKQSYILKDILTGKISADEAVDELEAPGLGSYTGAYAVVMFCFDNFTNRENREENNAGYTIDCIRDTAETVIRELMSMNFSCTVLNSSRKLVCISKGSSDYPEAFYNDIRCAAAKIQELTKEKYNLLISIAISGIHKDISELHSAYTESMKAYEYQQIMVTNSIIEYRDIEHIGAEGFPYSTEKENMLINTVKAGDEHKAIALLDEIYGDCLATSEGSVEIMKLLMYDLNVTVIRIKNEVFNELSVNKKLSFNIDESASVAEMYESIKGMIRNLCDNINSSFSKKQRSLCDKIASYIELHYADADFSNSKIAEVFGLNPTHLSKVFKEEMGINLLTYIHKVKVAKAKVMLQETNLSVAQISRNVGCVNSAALIRLFNKYEGVTPLVYRINSKKVKDDKNEI